MYEKTIEFLRREALVKKSGRHFRISRWKVFTNYFAHHLLHTFPLLFIILFPFKR